MQHSWLMDSAAGCQHNARVYKTGNVRCQGATCQVVKLADDQSRFKMTALSIPFLNYLDMTPADLVPLLACKPQYIRAHSLTDVIWLAPQVGTPGCYYSCEALLLPIPVAKS